MNEFLTFFLIVSTFACNVFCTINPSNLGLRPPPAPKDVEIGECFVVPEIVSELLNESYNYHHICPRKFTPSRPPRVYLYEKYWYFVGKLKDPETPSEEQPSFDYATVEQSLIQFVFLKETIVRFVLKYSNVEYKITFQTLQQSQTFYEMAYSDINLIPAHLPKKIYMAHEITTRETRKMGYVVKTLEDRINDWFYTVTFIDERGRPILVFSQNDASMVPFEDLQGDKPQLLLQIGSTHFILTFSNRDEAKKYNFQLIHGYVSELNMNSVDADVRSRFNSNRITIDIVQEFE